MSEEFKTPPPFVRCDECEGDGYILDDCNGNAMLKELPIDKKCPACAHSPLPGWLQQWYTHEQWVEYVRRENDLPNYELPDDRGVWIRVSVEGEWTPRKLKYALHDDAVVVVMDPDAGRPPEDWRPE